MVRPGSGPATPESVFWPMFAVAVVIPPQVLIPPQDRLGPPALVPIIEGTAFIGLLLITAKPGPVSRKARPTVLTLFVVLAAANAGGAIRLVVIVLGSDEVDGVPMTRTRLLVAGGLILATNIVTFGLIYWQLDAGGPDARLADPAPLPDFQFPQALAPQLAPPGWRPRFADHLYVSYTNLVAFSPTDTMPLTTRAKGLMAVQSIISVGVLVVVLSRVINLLPG
jgi:uncharacterized membrane protein